MNDEFSEFEFNYASIALTPYSDGIGTSSQLLKNIIQEFSKEDFPQEKKVIDRHLKRENTVSRKLVLISNRFGEKGLRCFGKIALIKNKAPLLLNVKGLVEEIEKEENKEFVEITNYIIHFHTSADPVIMFEFNNEGPRLSDIEYYFRQIARELRIAKGIQTSTHLKISYEQLDKELSNVFSVTVKVNTGNYDKFDWLKSLKTLNDDAGYRDVRLEFFYNRTKDKHGRYSKNIRGTGFARDIIESLMKKKEYIKYLDDLKMSYQVNDDDYIIELDFLKNKVTSFLKIPHSEKNMFKPSDFWEIVGFEFNNYLSKGLTSTNI